MTSESFYQTYQIFLFQTLCECHENKFNAQFDFYTVFGLAATSKQLRNYLSLVVTAFMRFLCYLSFMRFIT